MGNQPMGEGHLYGVNSKKTFEFSAVRRVRIISGFDGVSVAAPRWAVQCDEDRTIPRPSSEHDLFAISNILDCRWLHRGMTRKLQFLSIHIHYIKLQNILPHFHCMTVLVANGRSIEQARKRTSEESLFDLIRAPRSFQDDCWRGICPYTMLTRRCLFQGLFQRITVARREYFCTSVTIVRWFCCLPSLLLHAETRQVVYVHSMLFVRSKCIVF